MIAAGTQVGGYRLIEPIGEGGMGTVWLVEHAMLGRRAAIKLLHPSYTTREEVVTRFFNEARAATAIADPGIVQIFDFGYHTDGSAFIVMELLVGETLHARLERSGPFVIGDAVRIVRQIASSLGAAHARGIIHRDLKPENIFLVRDAEVPGGERAKILDFGIAKLTGDPSLKTNASVVIGTPAYMSPEQCRGAGEVDQRSDVYAMGCVLFALIAGRPPFVAAGAGELIALHLVSPPPRLATLVAGVPRDVERVVMKCLEKEAGGRYANALEVAGALGALLGLTSSVGETRPRLDVRATPVGGSPRVSATEAGALGAAPTTLSSASGVQPAVHPPRRRWLYIAAAIVGIAGGAAVVLVATSSSGDERTTAATHVDKPVVAPPDKPVVAPPPPPPDKSIAKPASDPRALVGIAMRDAFSRFGAWSLEHPGAACPDATVLGAADDPWGHTLRFTCTDQPANQIIGAVSAGPDGSLDTADDIASWQLANDVTEAVRGPRWVVKQPKHPKQPHESTPPPVVLDENGIPIKR